jgi:PAS domain S-box-containing protein
MVSPEFLQSVDSELDARMVVGESGTILFANQQVGHLLGYAPGALHGQSIELLMAERFRMPEKRTRSAFSAMC